MKELLALRKKLKKKKPKFYSQEYHKKIRLGKRWRKPRGTDSKVRLKLKGHVNRVSVGYGSPRKVRGLTRDGLNQILVSSSKDMQNLSEKDGIILSSKLGLRKKLDLLKEIKSKNMIVINLKDIDVFIKKAEEKIAKKKQEKTEKQKAEKEKQKEKKSKETELEKKIETEDEKKEREKKDKDQLLIKRDI